MAHEDEARARGSGQPRGAVEAVWLWRPRPVDRSQHGSASPKGGRLWRPLSARGLPKRRRVFGENAESWPPGLETLRSAPRGGVGGGHATLLGACLGRGSRSSTAQGTNCAVRASCARTQCAASRFEAPPCQGAATASSGVTRSGRCFSSAATGQGWGVPVGAAFREPGIASRGSSWRCPGGARPGPVAVLNYFLLALSHEQRRIFPVIGQLRGRRMPCDDGPEEKVSKLETFLSPYCRSASTRRDGAQAPCYRCRSESRSSALDRRPSARSSAP